MIYLILNVKGRTNQIMHISPTSQTNISSSKKSISSRRILRIGFKTLVNRPYRKNLNFNDNDCLRMTKALSELPYCYVVNTRKGLDR